MIKEVVAMNTVMQIFPGGEKLSFICWQCGLPEDRLGGSEEEYQWSGQQGQRVQPDVRRERAVPREYCQGKVRVLIWPLSYKKL